LINIFLAVIQRRFFTKHAGSYFSRNISVSEILSRFTRHTNDRTCSRPLDSLSRPVGLLTW
jgi:hypothetical protein